MTSSYQKKEEDYAVFATFTTEKKVFKNIPCKVFLPERIYEKPYFHIGPIDDEKKEIYHDFQGAFKADRAILIGQEEPRAYLTSSKVYFSSRITKYNNESGSTRKMKGEPQDLHIVENFRDKDQKDEGNHFSFWITTNSFLTPSASRTSYPNGNVEYKKIRSIEFFIKNSLKLFFKKKFETKDLENGELLQWSYLVAEADTNISIRDIEKIKKELLLSIDDFLLLVSFVTRFRTICVGWSGYDSRGFSTFYRGDYTFPDVEKKQNRNDTLIDIAGFNKFMEHCYPIFLRYPNKLSLRSAMYNIVPFISHTLEASFLRVFAGFETLILDYRRENNLEYVLDDNEDWSSLRKYLHKCIKESDEPKLTKNQRKLIYPKLNELNRISIREAFDQFSKQYSLCIDDLWPVFGNKDTIGLVDIRNKLIHGDPFPVDYMESLMVADEHLKFIFERMLLAVLEWPLEDSLVNPKYLAANFTAIVDLPISMSKLYSFMVADQPCLNYTNHTDITSERSYELIKKEDLVKLLDIAHSDLKAFFKKNQKYEKEYKNQEAIIVLAQGAALHYINHVNGIKDFDIWILFPKRSMNIPYRRRSVMDFGESKFGKHPSDIGFVGRRVDLLMRSDDSIRLSSPTQGLEKYLRKAATKTAKYLGEKPIIGLWPDNLMGKVLWMPNNKKEMSDPPPKKR